MNVNDDIGTIGVLGRRDQRDLDSSETESSSLSDQIRDPDHDPTVLPLEVD